MRKRKNPGGGGHTGDPRRINRKIVAPGQQVNSSQSRLRDSNSAEHEPDFKGRETAARRAEGWVALFEKLAAGLGRKKGGEHGI